MSQTNGKKRSEFIFIGMPSYERQTAAAGRAFWRACRNFDTVCWQYGEGSLLGQNFNSLWCSALNAAHRGESFRYFAMLHNDVGAEDFWLDKLIAELEEKQLDVLSVVVPIKDRRGLTSTAIHKPGDNWMPLARLTMSEVFRLPQTFTSDDIGAPILLNTGCWVCKWDQEWATQVHFEINDRIALNTKTNRYVALNESEDWFFSRLCHEQGLKLAATRKVKVAHRGEMDFVNYCPWGTHFFDSESVEASPIPAVDRDGFRFPHDVAGWLSFDEGKALFQLARDKVVLEIGSYCGRSTICLAQSAKHVTAVDYFDGRGTPQPRSTYRDFLDNVQRYGMADRVSNMSPDEIAPSESFDLVFIDGAHDYESVKIDIAKAMKALQPSGVLAFHDYRLSPGEGDGRWDPGVTQAVGEFIQLGAKLLSRHDSLAVVKPAALCEVTDG